MTKTLFYISGLLFLNSCSVLETRFYSAPVDHSKPVQKSSKVQTGKLNPRMNRFDQMSMPKEFEDSVDNTVINLSLDNEYKRAIVGPPFIPLFPFKSGYGHPDNKKAVREEEKDTYLVLHLSIKTGISDKVFFVPDSFYIKRSDQSIAKTVSVEGYAGGQAIECKYSNGWTSYIIRFEPGVHVKDLPELYLTSLKINGKQFREHPIRFIIGKRSFYSALISING